MAHGPTRVQLSKQLADERQAHAAVAREAAMLRQEIEYAHKATDAVRAQVKQIVSDRERLTATVEILARRLASDGREQTVNQASDRLIGGTAMDPLRYPKH